MLELEPGDVIGLHRDWYREGWAEGRLAAMRELREEAVRKSWAARLGAFMVGLVWGAALVGIAWILS